MKCYREDPDSFDRDLGFETFKIRYAKGMDEGLGPYATAPEFAADDWEWKRVLRLQNDGKRSMVVLCCPEDAVACTTHAAHEICYKCSVHVCSSCAWHLQITRKGIPMSLCNDNMWGYASGIITAYKVRWIEMAAILPFWTSMIVYYVEGDYGHLMNGGRHSQ